MIPASTELGLAVTAGSPDVRFVADLVYDGDVVIPDLPLEDCKLVSDSSQTVLTTGEAVIVYSDEFGSSITPRALHSWVGPFVSRLDVSMQVNVGGGWSESVLRGRLPITSVGDVEERFLRAGGRLYSTGARIRVQLADLFRPVDKARFQIPAGPESLVSVQQEIARLAGLAVDTDLDDAPIPRSVTYEENRLDAVMDLASVLDAYAYATPNGAAGLVSKTPGDPVLQLRSDATVTDVTPNGLSDEGVYNQVVVLSQDASQAAILAVASVTEGPLRVDGPYLARPYKVSSPYVTTKAQAEAYAKSLLPKVSQFPAVTYQVRCVPDPRVEVWDVVEVVTRSEVFTAQVTRVELETREMVLEVQRL